MNYANLSYKKLAETLTVLALINPISAGAGWFGPSNVDECILDGMKGVTSDAAAGAIYRSCHNKYPRQTPATTKIPDTVLEKLNGKGQITDYGYFSGTLYNGNTDWTITNLTIIIGPKVDPKNSRGGVQGREYDSIVDAPPLSNTKLSVAVDRAGLSTYDWNIVRGRGYKNK